MELVMSASRFLATAISVYTLLIWVRIMLTWIQIPGTYFESSPLLRFLASLVDPFLDMFRGIRWMRTRFIDFSPVMALMVLSIFQSIFTLFGVYGTITPQMVASLVVQALWNYILSPLCWFSMVLVGLELIMTYGRPGARSPFALVIDSLSRRFLDFVQHLFFPNRLVGLRRLAWWSFLFYVLLYAGLRYGVHLLASVLIGM